MRPTPRLAGALALGAVVYLFGASSQVTWLFLVAFLVWALAAAALPYARWNDRGLTASIRLAAVPTPPLFEGDVPTVDMEIRAAGRGARGPAALAGRVGGTAVAAGTGLVPAGGWRRRRPVGPAARGPLLAGDLRLETGDPLGLFRTRRPFPGGEIGVVYPRFASLAGAAAGGEVRADALPGRTGRGTELAGVRDYRRGDPARDIHWRTSARVGHLVVREHEPPGRTTLGVLLDADPPTREVADQAARIAASEVWDCLHEGGLAALWAPGLRSAGPAGSSGLWMLMDWLARYPALPPAGYPPPRSTTVVAVACRAEGGALRALDERRAAAGEARAWLIGDAAATTEPAVPTRRVGTRWPLA